MKKFLILMTLICFTLLTGCGGNGIQTIKPRVGLIVSSFSETAKTRLAHIYTLTMPISGEMNKISLQAGDKIKKDEVLASLKQYPLNLAATEEQAKFLTLYNFLEAEKEREKSLTATQGFAKRTLRRNEELGVKKFVSEESVDQSQTNAITSALDVKQQGMNIAAIDSAMELTKAQLKESLYNLNISKIKSPVNGVILNRYTQGNQWLPAGTQLFRVGNMQDLEGVSDVLTTQAQQLHTGDKVLISLDGDRYTYNATVKQIDPAGFTKRSALGVDEQRVQVIIKLTDIQKMNIGVAYRLYAKFITGTKDNALIIPRYSVLQDQQGNNYVFVVKNGRMEKQIVKLGLINDTQVSIIQGLSKNKTIVATPTAAMYTGMKI